MFDAVVLPAIAIYLAYAILGIVMVRLRVRWLDPSRIAAASVDTLYEERPGLRDAVARLAPLGFVSVAGASVDHAPTYPRVIILRRPDEEATGSVSSFRRGTRTLVVTEFSQRDAQGNARSVNDSPMARANPQLACSQSLRLPGSTPEQLWRAFQHVRESERARGRWRAVAAGDEVESLRRHCRRQVAELLDRGLVTLPADGPPRLTALAAITFTVKLLWPIKYIVSRVQVAQARRSAGLA